jgi:acyl carrier protein
LLARLEPVTLLHGVPSLMRQVVEWLGSRPRALPSLRTVLVGGEAVKSDLLSRMREVFSGARLVVLYGPTESTIICASAEVPAQGETPGRLVGRPLPGVELRVVDRSGLLVPQGVAGELWVGGPGVSRGYLGRPDLTADRFRPRADGGRFYRTGDLVRHATDGTLEFLGRTDEQVKVRGFRVEPGEVEAALSAHPGVRETVVVVRDSQLVAYVVGEPEVSALREHLAASLPPYMVPSAFVKMESLPRLPSGKVDRRGLAQREPASPERSAEWVAPRTPSEELMAQLWSEVLRRERVGAHDNFFELGGHSLLATQLISRVGKAFGVELPLRALFERPTVAGLSRAVEEARRADRGLAAPPITRVERTGDLPLSFAQQRLWFIDQLAQGSVFYNSPYPLRLKGDLELMALERTLSEIVRRHEVLRSSFPARDGQPVQRIAPPQPTALPVVDLSGLAGETREREMQRLVDEDAQRPFDLTRGPLLRATLLRLDRTDHVLSFIMHHVVSDGWSMGVVVREVSALYPAFRAGLPSPLPELPVQYADFAVWQREYLTGEVLESQLSYWRQRLGGRLPVLDLPTDRPRSPIQTYRGAIELQTFSPDLYPKLTRLSRQHGATLFMTALAAFNVLLHRITGKDDVIVGSAVAGRNRVETEALIGFFVNMLPIRVDLSQSPSFLQILSRTREAALGAFSFQDVPLEKLIEDLQPERYGSRTLLFEVAFGFRSEVDHRLELPGIALEPVQKESSSVRLDLSLWVMERGGALYASWFYNTDLFEAATIRRLADRYATILEHVAEAPETLLGAIEIHSEAEKRELAEEQARKQEAEAQSVRSGRRKAIPLTH